MMRGSVPLLWCEADAVMTLKPKPDIAPKELQGAPMDVHLKDMRGSYGNIILLSLIEQREQSHERQLGLLFDAQMTKVTGEAVPPPGTEFDEAAERKKRGPVTYIPFDFHSVCGKLAFRNLPKLVKVCVEALREDCSFFIAGKQKQVGTFRVNCIDCLDRTNVAQSVLAFRAALWQLEALALIQKDERKACEDKVTKEERQPYPWAEHLDQTLKHMWADHGDAISLQVLQPLVVFRVRVYWL
ncbi:hypothetical protein T484DRAFT_2805300 [Baffinella frigidus]|nr:hypothetical protein T484DRAFT_2805300 [Cryptophyta sp. CCMP2293]